MIQPNNAPLNIEFNLDEADPAPAVITAREDPIYPPEIEEIYHRTVKI